MSNQSGIILAPGETGKETADFSPNIVLSWLKTTIVVTNRRIVYKQPNTLAGIIPLGYAESSMPIGAVAGVSVNVKFKALRAILGAFVALVSLGVFSASAFVGIVLLVIGVLLLLTCVAAEMELTNSGGGKQGVGVSILEKDKLETFRDHLNASLYSDGGGAGYGAPPQGLGYGVNQPPMHGHQQHASLHTPDPTVQGSPAGYGHQQSSPAHSAPGYPAPHGYPAPQGQAPQGYPEPHGYPQAPEPTMPSGDQGGRLADPDQERTQVVNPRHSGHSGPEGPRG